jgi:Asp-tRNA(Asn)/Glu-tRNA(Gln) amidotransferase A subunit family amidase
MITEYDDLDALALAALVRSKQVSASEVLETALNRIARRNPALNALVTPLFESARGEVAAGLPEGPFTGVPFALKELVVSVLGAPSTAASRLYADAMPASDSEIVTRLRRAGLVILGKTNSSEFGLAPATESALFGATRNPWNTDLSPGGSSGGAAAMVAARMLPMTHATDGGGSIRIPASCCGLFGLKPTRGRISFGPEGGEGLSGLAHQHAVTRSVRDSAALLDIVAGPMAGDPYSAPKPERPFLQEVGAPPGRLRIGFATAAPGGFDVDPACIEAVHAAARLCESLGHEVQEARPEFNADLVFADFTTVFQVGAAANVARRTGGGLPDPGLLEPLTYAAAERGQKIGAADYMLALGRLHREARRVATFFERYDIWLTPTLTMPPRPLGFFDTATGDVDSWFRRVVAFIPFTVLCNITGQPAANLPLHWNDAGLPLGCQFAARYGEEATLFRLSAQLEQAQPWQQRKPPGLKD